MTPFRYWFNFEWVACGSLLFATTIFPCRSVRSSQGQFPTSPNSINHERESLLDPWKRTQARYQGGYRSVRQRANSGKPEITDRRGPFWGYVIIHRSYKCLKCMIIKIRANPSFRRALPGNTLGTPACVALAEVLKGLKSLKVRLTIPICSPNAFETVNLLGDLIIYDVGRQFRGYFHWAPHFGNPSSYRSPHRCFNLHYNPRRNRSFR